MAYSNPRQRVYFTYCEVLPHVRNWKIVKGKTQTPEREDKGGVSGDQSMLETVRVDVAVMTMDLMGVNPCTL